MAALEAIRAEIVARMRSVANVGVVHDHEPYAKDMAGLQAFYVSEIEGERVLRGWFVQRVATDREAASKEMRRTVHTWRIRGYMALSEEAGSEIAFDAMIEALRARFDSNDYMLDLNLDTLADEVAGLQLKESKPVLFAGVLCHAAELALYTSEWV